MEKIRKQLLSEKGDLVRQLAIYKAEDPYLDTNQTIANTAEDDVTDTEGHDRIVAKRLELKQRLSEVEAAIGKIDEGKYGVCEACGTKISPGRLKAIATARFCLECKSKVRDQ
ncbi:MAG TPA: TraR/DksA C4-type zinc finger protein [Candidatus Nanoarchaeia archaeon]